MTGLTRGSQVRLRCFQGFLTSSSIFVVDVTLTAVQPCFKEGDLINPVALVLALMVSHSLRKNPVHGPFIEEDRSSCWKDGLSRSFLHGFPLSRSGGGGESPAHLRQEWGGLSYVSLPTPLLSQDRDQAVCHCWREAKCRAFQASGAKVPGGGLFDSDECPPTRR